ncbi:hypothetical protein C723_2089 [Christiangramia flava JLT2011]|uniref:Uncharacterized protein n=1 Tax=Christiangramia flava JLT2011 TaxID=1229726 RepID=A0A1L7I6N8_9FLAO|nr:hypothetical protein GRFL_2048 [Christiangramia flava JLT2011]OSS39083.1 hypothetical protein C723_2089 [Christiangramia flava JLT2011]
MFVDSTNTLWIGTDNGIVSKKNGVFESYFEEDGLALNSCWAISEDIFQNMWFGSYGAGISIYNGTEFRIISENDGLVHNEITKLFPYGDFMYVGTSDGVSRINIKNYKVSSWDYSETDDLFRVSGFFEYKDQLYLTTYKTGVYSVAEDENTLRLKKINDRKPIYSVFVKNDSIYSNQKGYSTKEHLAKYLQQNASENTEQLGKSIIWQQVQTKNDKMFAGAWGIYDTSGGIFEIDGEKFVSRAADFNVNSNQVYSLEYDPELDKLYIGTLDEGLHEINLSQDVSFHPLPGKVLGFTRTKFSSATLSSQGLQIIGKTSNTISLKRFKEWQENYVSKNSLNLPKHEDSFYELDYETPAEEIRFYDIKVFEENYWINTNIGIFAVGNSGKLKRYIPIHSEEINFTQDGKLIETHPYGGVRVYTDLNAFDYHYYSPEDPATPTMIVNSFRNEEETYFLSVFSGLYKWRNDRFISYLNSDIWPEKQLRHISPIGDKLAISTEFGDIYIVNDHKSFEILKKIPRAKIQGNTISFLSSYKEYLIIATEKGLTFLNNEKQIFLDKEQGLNQPLLATELFKNHLFVGSEGGFYILELDRILEAERKINELKLTEIRINNNEKSLKNLSSKNELEFDHDENTVLIKFATNAHPFPDKLRYQYKLHPKEKWSLPFSKSEIFLPFLSSSTYDIQVKVTDYSTGTKYHQKLLNLAIKPPFWKTWWFYLLIIAGITLLILSIYRYEIRKNKRFESQKSLIQKRFEETKMEALLAQMNPHFIFNAMNSIQNFILENNVEKASEFLGDFAKLIRLNLEYCTKPKISLEEEILYLKSYIKVENTRFNDSVKVNFHVDPDIDTYEVEVPSMLMQTFIENVFVHAFPPKIKNPTLNISFNELDSGSIECRIQDNGIGYENASENSSHQSKGTSLARERLAFMGYNNQSLQISSNKGKGTLVILIL